MGLFGGEVDGHLQLLILEILYLNMLKYMDAALFCDTIVIYISICLNIWLLVYFVIPL